uniref:Ig-like domain-containing protein n=1 Tax=Oryctolagus cuniculus TaxID=9986 RepID=A0A5F9D8W3_RABIT
MGNRLLCCMVIWLLTNAVVTQSPRHRVSGTGKTLTLRCSQDMSHVAMYWYRQDPGLGLQLIYYSPGVSSTEKGDTSEGYNVSRKELGHFPLMLESTSTKQTSVYICASSSSTVLHSHILFSQKGVNQGMQSQQGFHLLTIS